MIGMPSFDAFSSLAGHMLSPANMKSVFLEMEPVFFPPLSSMIFCYSSREWRANVPDITTVFPASRVEVFAASLSGSSICNP